MDLTKPFVAYCTSPQFAKKVGQRLRAKDGSVIVITEVSRPRYNEGEMRYRYTYLARAATPEEAAAALAADDAARAATAAARAAAVAADDSFR